MVILESLERSKLYRWSMEVQNHAFLKKMFTKCFVIPFLWIYRISVWKNIWRVKKYKKWHIIENNLTEHREYIIENGYTSFISPSNINDIIDTVLVSIVTKRLTYLKQFYTGLDLPGFRLILKGNSELLKPIFVGQVEEVDVNFLLLLA